MKIAVIAHAHFAIKQPFAGGLEAHTHELIAELVRQGHDVTAYAKAGSETAGKLVPIFSGNPYGGDSPVYVLSYRRAMRKVAKGKYDLIINNGLNFIPLLLHTTAMPPMLTVFHTPPYSKVSDVLESQFTRANRAYIAVSDFTAQQWQPYCVDRIHVVPNGMDSMNWHPNMMTPPSPVAAWVGRITPEKGTHVAIEACLEAGVPLRLAGPVYDRKYFDTTIRPLLEHESITYLGHIDHDGVNRLLAEASVALVTPLWDEPFGLVAIEAWASGTPVAALPNGALPSLVHPSVGSLAASESAEDLAQAIKRALPADREQCYRYAAENFSLSAMVDSYLALVPQPIGFEDTDADLLWQPAQ